MSISFTLLFMFLFFCPSKSARRGHPENLSEMHYKNSHMASILVPSPLTTKDQCSNKTHTSPSQAHLQTPAPGSGHPPCGHHSSRFLLPFRLPATPPFLLLLLQVSLLRPQCQRNSHRRFPRNTPDYNINI